MLELNRDHEELTLWGNRRGLETPMHPTNLGIRDHSLSSRTALVSNNGDVCGSSTSIIRRKLDALW